MLARFNNEVLSYGPNAVLPQNLNDEWLQILQKMADDFLDTNFDLDVCNEPGDVGDPILLACIYEIARYQDGPQTNYSDKELAEKMVVYALAIMMESINRESHIGLAPPDLDNVLSVDRIIAYQDINPKFIKVLKQACILGNSEKSWFGSLREKLLSGD